MKRAGIILIILAAGFGGGWITRSVMVPNYPSHWDAVKLGMTTSEAKSAVPGLDAGLREIKGFDQTGLDLGDRYWNLLVSYDAHTAGCPRSPRITLIGGSASSIAHLWSRSRDGRINQANKTLHPTAGSAPV